MSLWFWGIKGTMAQLTKAVIEAAIHGFEARKRDIDIQIAELRELLTGADSAHTATPPEHKRRHVSAAARKRMREAQRARWAKIKGESISPAKAAAKAAKRKGGLTPEGRKKLSLAMKKRWAAKKASA